MSRTEARHFGPGDSRFRIHQPTIRPLGVDTDLAQLTMREYHCALQARVSNQEVAAQADDMNRLKRWPRSDKPDQCIQAVREIGALRSTTRTPAGVFAHRFVRSQFAARLVP